MNLIACCVGHEIVGKAVKVGNNVKHVKVGDRGNGTHSINLSNNVLTMISQSASVPNLPVVANA